MSAPQALRLPSHSRGGANGRYERRFPLLIRRLQGMIPILIMPFRLLKTFATQALSVALRKENLQQARRKLVRACWVLLDNIILLQMGATYKRRFEDFAIIATDILAIDQWRKDQQDEWNRLSVTLALLATMNTTILAISPQAPSLAFAAWLGGAGLSVCGVFVVQYFSIKAFSITDEDMGLLLQDDGVSLCPVDEAVLASVIAGPVVMKLWSTVLFLIGTIDYIAETEAISTVYKAVAFLPVLSGTAVVLLTMMVGEVIDRKLCDKYRKE